jgi:hypothetical protein
MESPATQRLTANVSNVKGGKGDVCAAAAQLLTNLAARAKLREKIDAMFNGEHINVTEDRAVLHVALRTPRHKARPPLLSLSYSPLPALLPAGLPRQLPCPHALQSWAAQPTAGLSGSAVPRGLPVLAVTGDHHGWQERGAGRVGGPRQDQGLHREGAPIPPGNPPGLVACPAQCLWSRCAMHITRVAKTRLHGVSKG